MNKLLETDEEDYVIAIDTDSLYIRINNSSRNSILKILLSFNEICKTHFEKVLTKSYQEFADYSLNE